MLVFCFVFCMVNTSKERKLKNSGINSLTFVFFIFLYNRRTNQPRPFSMELVKSNNKDWKDSKWVNHHKELMIVTKCAFPFCPDYWLRGKSMWATWVIWPECHLNEARSCPMTVTFDTWRIERTALPTNLILGSVSTATGDWGFERLCHGKKGRDAPSFWKN